MADVLRFTILGCGSSPGVPRIGGDWGACDPNEPRNRRRRASLLVERIGSEGRTIVVVDTGPDFREQMIDADVAWADAVLYTHAHADHIHGIDDLRSFVINRRALVDVWCDEATSERLHEAFGYCFRTPEGSLYPPLLREHRIRTSEPIVVEGAGGPIVARPFRQQHGGIHSLGFRFGSVAYSSDVSSLSVEAEIALEDLDVWIVDALQPREHPSHFSLRQALTWIERIKPRRAYLTHMHTPMDYRTVLADTPDHVEPSYDGLRFEVPAPAEEQVP